MAAPVLAGDTPLQLSDIVVTTPNRQPTRLRDSPETIQVIDRAEIDSLNASTTGELLSYLPGISVTTGTGSGLPNRSVVSINGFSPADTLVLVDGVRLLSEHFHTGRNIESIPPKAIERIEIIRGGMSAQYGSDAIGGVVNIITRKAGNQAESEIGGAAGEFSTYESYLSILAPVNDKVRVSSFVNSEQSQGAELRAPAHRIGKMGYRRVNLLQRLDIQATPDTQVYAWLNYVDNTMDWRTGPSDSYLVTPVLGARQQLGDHLAVSGQVYYTTWFAEAAGEENQLIEPRLWTNWSINAQHAVVAGVEYKWREFERSGVQTHQQNAHAYFMQHDWRPHRLLKLSTALRLDKVESVDLAVSPKASVLFGPMANVNLRASIGRAFHAPTIQELYEQGYGHGGRAYRFGNPDLDPEYSTNYTLGLDWQPIRQVNLHLYGYYSDIDDKIVPVYQGLWEDNPDPSNPIDKWERMNIQDARVYGGEAELRIQWLRSLRTEVSYAVSDNEDKDSGRQLPYSPGHKVTGRLIGFQSLPWDWRIEGFAGVRAEFDRSAWSWKPAPGEAENTVDGLNTDLDDYTQLDLGIMFTYADQLDLFFRLENVLGEDIENLDDALTIIEGQPLVRGGIEWRVTY